MQRDRKKRVSVTFVPDEDVVQHILHIEDKKNGRSRRSVKRSLSYSAGVDMHGKKRSMNTEVIEGSSEEEDNPSALPALSQVDDLEDDSITGQEVFSFRSAKKSGQMAVKASESRKCMTPTSGSHKKKDAKKTVEKGKAGESSLSAMKTSTPRTPAGRSKKGARSNRAPQTTTPYRLRKRNVVEDSSDEDSVGEDSDDDDLDDDEDIDTERSKQADKSQASLQLTTNIEEYFDVHAAGVVTSDRTLSRLDLPQMDVGQLRDTLERAGTTHTSHRTSLCNRHRQLFRRWMFTMCNGFNVLLYGLGSKRDLLEEFRAKFLSQYSHIVVNGYFPSLTIKQILTSITEDIFGHEGTFRSPLDQLEFIKNHLENEDPRDVYLVLHNVDGGMLRGEKTQTVLSLLAQVTGVHILASIDQINAPLIWDQAKASRLRWVWEDVTTYSPYLAETSYENSLLLQQSRGLALRSLDHVMHSLTPNARRIFYLLARYQLDNADTSAFVGMAFQDLYQRCREAFLVNSDQTLRAQLVEFRDHKLIRARKNYDGVEHLMIPIDSAALKEFLEQEEK